MALYLEGKTPLKTSDLSPKEATHMSRDVKTDQLQLTKPGYQLYCSSLFLV